MTMMIGTKTNQSLTLLSLLALSVLSLCGRPTTAFVPQQAITTKTAVSCPNGVSVTETKRRSMLLWGTTTVNGDVAAHIKDVEKDGTSSRTEGTLSPAPPLTYDKYVTMQGKRVAVTIQYSGASGLKPYYLTVAKKIKLSHPDVIVEKRILPALYGDVEGDVTFEVLVDGKVVVGKSSIQMLRGGDDLAGSLSVFVSMQELDLAINRARRRRRPSTSYGHDCQTGATLEVLRSLPTDQEDE